MTQPARFPAPSPTFPEVVPTLTDGVVTLRAHRAGDVQGVLEQCRDPLSQQWTTVPVPFSRADAEEYVTAIIPAGWAAGSWGFAVEAADDDGRPRFCGTVELRDQGSRRAEVAYGAHPWARGRGIVQRALRLLLAWGFEQQGLRAVIWWADRGNWASRRTAWRLGFSCDGTVPRWLTQRGELRDGWVGVLHADDPREPRTPWLEVPRIEGGTVTLRAFAPGDAPRVQEACADERTSYWLHRMPQPYTLADAEAYLDSRVEQLATASGVTWAVTDPRTDLVVGALSAFDLRPGLDAEIGYWTHPAARGRGVMTEALGLVVRHAFIAPEDGGLGLSRLQVRAAVGNTASRRVIEANGFTEVGVLRGAERLGDGSVTDCVVYDRLAGEPS